MRQSVKGRLPDVRRRIDGACVRAAGPAQHAQPPRRLKLTGAAVWRIRVAPYRVIAAIAADRRIVRVIDVAEPTRRRAPALSATRAGVGAQRESPERRSDDKGCERDGDGQRRHPVGTTAQQRLRRKGGH